MKMKVCTKCKREMPYTKEYFQGFVDKRNGKFRFRSDCKECQKAYTKGWKERNEEKSAGYYKKWYKENKGYHKEYRNKNREHLKRYGKGWYKENKEHHKDYYKENEGDIKKYHKIWRKENKEHLLVYMREYKQKRIARAKTLPHTLNTDEWTAIKFKFNSSCAYCGMTEEMHFKKFGERLHQDHFVPLSNGGGYTVDNIIPACRSCNSSKNDKPFSEWYRHYKHYSKDRERFVKIHLSEVRNA